MSGPVKALGVLFLAALACRSSPAGVAPELDGLWEGSVRSGGVSHLLRLDFRRQGPDLAGLIDLPDQYARSYRLQKVRLEGAVLSFELPEVLPPAAFTGTVERGRIRGTLTSSAAAEPIHGVFEVWHRPREARPYRAEEVSFRNGEVRLSGTLFLPKGPGPHAAVVFLHGSGPQTRESYLRHFADAFARRGVAALIYDKRGTERTDLPPWLRGGGTFQDLADDALAGARFLRGRTEIDARRIGLWGLSQGAWLAPLAAARSTGEIAFLILLSGGGVTPAEQELYDDEVKLRAHGVAETSIARALALLRLADDYVRSGADADWQRLQAELDAARREPWFPLLDRFPLILPREAPAWEGLRPDLDYDPRPVLAQTRIPVLAILGEADALTPAGETASRLRTALAEAGNPEVTIRLVPGADHALLVPVQPAAGWLGERPAEGWEDGMTDWLLRHSRAPGAPSRLSNRK